jgi:hypothetical protein
MTKILLGFYNINEWTSQEIYQDMQKKIELSERMKKEGVSDEEIQKAIQEFCSQAKKVRCIQIVGYPRPSKSG